jgi:hypothetical protein
VPQLALLTRWDTADVVGGTGGALTEIPSELIPVLLQLDVSVESTVRVELSYVLRRRDREDRIRAVPEPEDILVPPSTAAFAPAAPATPKR